MKTTKEGYMPDPETHLPWGVRLRQFREGERRESRDEFAKAVRQQGVTLHEPVGCDKRLVSRWEDGEVARPRAVYVRLLVALGAPVPEPNAIALPTSAVSAHSTDSAHSPTVVPKVHRLEGDEVLRREFLGAVASAVVGAASGLSEWLPPTPPGLVPSPSRVGQSDVEYLRSMTSTLHAADHRFGGCATADSIAGLLNWGNSLLPGCRAQDIADDLTRALANLANLAGWSFHDAGRQDLARGYFMHALSYSRADTTNALTAPILYGLGRVALLERQPHDALKLLQLGQLSAQETSSGGESARLYANEAMAYAMLGRPRQTFDALARAEHEMSLVADAEVKPWQRTFFTSGDFTGHKAWVTSELAAAAPEQRENHSIRAVELAKQSVAASGDDRSARSLLFDRIIIAANSFRVSDVDLGVVAAEEALGLAKQIRSARAVIRLQEVATAAQPHQRKHSSVRDMSAEIRALARSAVAA